MVCTGAKRYAEPLSKPSQTNNSVYKTGKDRIYVPKHLGGAKYFAEELHEMHFIAWNAKLGVKNIQLCNTDSCPILQFPH